MSSASVDPINNFETNTGSFRAGGVRDAGAPKRIMDVEEVLAWAFRDELPKDRGEGGRHGPPAYSSPLGRMVAMGTSVDNWSREPGHPAALGPCDPDALVVASAVEDLAGLADQAIEGELDLVPDFGSLGQVDEEKAVRRALCQLPAIVARCARMGQRPDWRATTSPGPVRTGNGRAQVVRWARRQSKTIDGRTFDEQQLAPVTAGSGNDGYPWNSYCPLQYEPSLQSIAEERAEYLTWWGALDTLALALAGRLAGITVLPPLAPQRPWRQELEPVNPRLILNDREGRAFRRESREAAAAHRMLGQRRAQNFRGGARPGTAPTRLVPAARPANRACAPA